MMRLEENPFYLLGAGVESTKADITQKADDKCFDEPELEEDIEKAKGILLNPQRRIAAEIRWFPGCCGSSFQQNLADKFQDLNIYAMGGNELCKLNILLVQLEGLKKIDDIIVKILAIDDMYGKISLEDIRQWLNKDRQKAKLPEIQDVQPIEAVWKEYRQDIGRQLQDICHSRLSREAFSLAAIEIAKRANSHRLCGPVVQDFIAMYDLYVAEDKDGCYNEAIEQLDDFEIDANDIEDVNSALRDIMNLTKPVCIINEAMGIDKYPLAAGVFNKLIDVAVSLWDAGEQEKAIHLLETAKAQFEGIEAFVVRIDGDLKTARKNYTPPQPATHTVSATTNSSTSTSASTKSYRTTTSTTASTSSRTTRTTTYSSNSVNRSGQLSPDKGSSSDSSSDAAGCCGCLGAVVFLGVGGATLGPLGFIIAAVILVAIAASDE